MQFAPGVARAQDAQVDGLTFKSSSCCFVTFKKTWGCCTSMFLAYPVHVSAGAPDQVVQRCLSSLLVWLEERGRPCDVDLVAWQAGTLPEFLRAVEQLGSLALGHFRVVYSHVVGS